MDTETKKLMLNRLSRAEGQIRALKTSLESGKVKDCKTFLTQVNAVTAALKRARDQYVLEHIHKCQSLPKKERAAQIDQALKMLHGD